jgi:hypothetical protein
MFLFNHGCGKERVREERKGVDSEGDEKKLQQVQNLESFSIGLGYWEHLWTVYFLFRINV